MSVPSPRTVWKPALIAAALAFVYLGVLWKLGTDWWSDENYSHGLLIPLVIGYILWTERERLSRSTSRPRTGWGAAAVVFAMLALWIGVAGAELYVQRMSLLLMLAGVVVYFWGFRLLRPLAVPAALLLLAIPVPAIIFNKIAFPLQLFASRCAVWVMRLFDIPVLRQGNVIELMPRGAQTTRKLEVVEACSGIRSLMTLLTLAVVFAYFTHPRREGGGPNDAAGGGGGWLRALKSYGFWRSTLLVASAVPIAIFTNALRVSGTGVLAHYYGTEVADGFFHSFSGWVVYIVAFLLLFAVGWLLDKIGRRGGGPGKPKAQEAATEKSEAKPAAGGEAEPALKPSTVGASTVGASTVGASTVGASPAVIRAEGVE